MTKKLCTLTLFIFAISILLFPFGASAQTRDLGLIKGHVVDAQGKAVPGADVKLEDKSTKAERDTARLAPTANTLSADFPLAANMFSPSPLQISRRLRNPISSFALISPPLSTLP